ncbi:MAG: outer membrane beta-barrel protein [Pseudomonadota bacterium]
MKAVRIRLSFFFAMLIAAPGFAQSPDLDQLEGRGIRAGAFLFYPTATLEQAINSNVFLSSLNRQSTYHAALAPRLFVHSDWNRHALRLDIGTKAGVFTHDSADNFLDYDAALAGQADITRKARLTGEVRFSHDSDERGTNDVPTASDSPVEFSELEARIQGEWLYGSARIGPFAEWRRLDFDDTGLLGGGINNQDDRDRTELRTGVALGLKVIRGYEGFVSAAYVQTEYASALDDTGIDRDSTGFQLLGGVNIQLSRLVEGIVSGGLTQRHFDDPTLRDVTEITGEVGLIWKPTRRLTATADLSRKLRETTLAGASALLVTEGALGLNYELLRTVTVKLNVNAARLQFQDITRADNTFGTLLSADWAVTRHLTLSPGYEFDMRRSRTPGLGYTAHRIFLDARYAF